MDAERLERLLEGEVPTLNDYASFVGVVEELPLQLIWDMSIKAPKLNHTLRSVLDKQLAKKVAGHNVDRAMHGILMRLAARFPVQSPD